MAAADGSHAFCFAVFCPGDEDLVLNAGEIVDVLSVSLDDISFIDPFDLRVGGGMLRHIPGGLAAGRIAGHRAVGSTVRRPAGHGRRFRIHLKVLPAAFDGILLGGHIHIPGTAAVKNEISAGLCRNEFLHGLVQFVVIRELIEVIAVRGHGGGTAIGILRIGKNGLQGRDQADGQQDAGRGCDQGSAARARGLFGPGSADGLRCGRNRLHICRGIRLTDGVFRLDTGQPLLHGVRRETVRCPQPVMLESVPDILQILFKILVIYHDKYPLNFFRLRERLDRTDPAVFPVRSAISRLFRPATAENRTMFRSSSLSWSRA